MSELPRTLIEFQRQFADEPACAAVLAAMRWPGGFRCPSCGHERGWALKARAHVFECAGCRRQTSLTAGTVMHGSKPPLTVWLLEDGRVRPSIEWLRGRSCPRPGKEMT